MKYRESKVDKQLREWFLNDFSKSLLRRIALENGKLRGLNALDLSVAFPILAIAGRNGSGKSTVLAMACCAYHSSKLSYKQPRRKNSYYTFSDFFIQHTEEISPQGISIAYGFAIDWMKKTDYPDGKGIGYQWRKKSQGGKWNDYDARINRTVVFVGIDRIVPHSERSQSRSYSKAFARVKPKGWEGDVASIVGYILNRVYDDFRYEEYSKYSMPLVKVGDHVYSGFNMGAGESALFEIFSTIYSAGPGCMLVIDEIELGLHAEAQKRFLVKLKEVTLDRKCQIICTTHSKHILDGLPYDGRVYIESVNGKTKLTDAISSEFAFAKLGGDSGKELELLVEDEVGRSIILAAMPAVLRSRVTVCVIGSSSALARQLAASYLKNKDAPILALYDGDQAAREKANLAHAKAMAENPKADFISWYSERISYLPGNTWPELWLLQKCEEYSKELADAFNAEEDQFCDSVEYAKQAGKHNEFYELAENLGLNRGECLQIVTNKISTLCKKEFDPLLLSISNAINGVV